MSKQALTLRNLATGDITALVDDEPLYVNLGMHPMTVRAYMALGRPYLGVTLWAYDAGVLVAYELLTAATYSEASDAWVEAGK